MGSLARLTLALACGLALAGCGDPVSVIGDWPGTLRIVAGVPDSAGPTLDSLATRTRLRAPRALAVDAEGVLYIADYEARRILAVRSNGRTRVVASSLSCAGGACLTTPEALAFDDAGRLLIADLVAHSVWRLDPRSGAFTRFAGTGTSGTSPDGTPAGEAMLNGPAGLAVAADGRLFVSELHAGRVAVVGTDGALRRFAGGASDGTIGDGGPATAARLHSPAGLAVFGTMLYIADRGAHRVRAVDLGTAIISTVAGTGNPMFRGDGGPATAASLNFPAAVAVSPDGASLFIADMQNHRVRVVDLATGIIDTYAGTGQTRFNGTGSAGATALHNPLGVATSAFDFVFIADTGHHIVWRGPLGY